MKRPLVAITVMFASGIAAAHEIHSLNFLLILSGIMLFVAVAGCAFFGCRECIFIAAVVFFAAGCTEYAIASRSLEKKATSFSGEYVSAQGFVDSVPEEGEYRTRFVFRITEVTCCDTGRESETSMKVRVILSGRGGISPGYGEGILVKGYFAKPSGSRNPGGFDERTYLAQKGVCGVLFARGDSVVKTGKSGGSEAVKLGNALRKAMTGIINRSLPTQQAALLNGMLIGYRDDLGEDVEKAFADSGLLHIMAVSGANVAFIVLPLLFLFNRTGINRLLSRAIIIVLLKIFILITGFEPSVVRAVIMADVMLLAKIFRRETDVYTSIAFAALVMLLFNPFILFSVGFRLSFAATVSLCLFYANVKKLMKGLKIPDIIKDTIAGTVSAQLGVIPLSAFYFNSVSIISILSNVIVIPLTGIITILGLVMTAVGGISIFFSQAVGHINYAMLSIVLFTAGFTSKLPFAVKTLATPSTAAIAAYYILLILFLWYVPRKSIQIKKALPVAVVVLLVFSLPALAEKILEGKLEVVFIDVGNGDSVYIETPKGYKFLIDGGERGEVVPCLLELGALELDAIIATHEHSDHIGGLEKVMEALVVKRLILPGDTCQPSFEKLVRLAEEKGICVTAVNTGDRIMTGKRMVMEVLHPSRNTRFLGNDGSLVLRLLYGNTAILFTGDVETGAERAMLDRSMDLSAHVLKVAHHGSGTSSSQEFLDTVRPRAAVISAGNHPAHPSDEVVQRLNSMGIAQFCTEEDGAVILKTDGRRVWIKKWLDGLKSRGL